MKNKLGYFYVTAKSIFRIFCHSKVREAMFDEGEAMFEDREAMLKSVCGRVVVGLGEGMDPMHCLFTAKVRLGCDSKRFCGGARISNNPHPH